MFSPATCNFFVPFALKDARFGFAANPQTADRPRKSYTIQEMKA
jgi:hypothetical protein